jgi:hypothetical protein
MRKLTSLSAILLCAALAPCALKAQDSAVTVGDNSGTGTLGGPGKPKPKVPDHIGAQHIKDHGFEKNNGKNHDAREENYQPVCLDVTGTNTDLLAYPLKGQQWDLTVAGGGKSITLVWPSAQNKSQILITTDPGLLQTTGNPPYEVYRTDASKVESATLNIPGVDYKTFTTKDKGKVQFTIHYCKNGQCGNDGTTGKPICP